MDYNGFVYIWMDKKRNMFYIGSHYGKEDDGYICSSKTMMKLYRKRPETFKRRILEYVDGSPQDVFESEERWLSKIKEHEMFLAENRRNKTARYYNIKKSGSGVDSETARILKQQFWDSEEGQKQKELLRERMKGNTIMVGKEPWNKGKKCDQIANSLKTYYSNRTEEEKKEHSRRYSETIKRLWAQGVFDNRPPPTKEAIEKTRQANLGRKQTDYQKQRAREANLGKIVSADTRKKMSEKAKLRPPVQCPHCGHIGKGPQMYRYHFKNCKYK